MSKLAGVCLFVSLLLDAQTITTKRLTPRKPPKPACAKAAICFSGEVREGEEFRRALNDDLDFVLRPGWVITIVPRHPVSNECDEFAGVTNPPYRAHRSIYIDASYEWTSEDEVRNSTREFSFVTNCSDLQTEWGRLRIVLGSREATPAEYENAMQKLGSLATGEGRLWITASKTSTRTPEKGVEGHGAIEWMKFSVEIKLPEPK